MKDRNTRGGKEEIKEKKGVKYEWLAESKTSITRIHLLGHDPG
jgi:hypothetical protein